MLFKNLVFVILALLGLVSATIKDNLPCDDFVKMILELSSECSRRFLTQKIQNSVRVINSALAFTPCFDILKKQKILINSYTRNNNKAKLLTVPKIYADPLVKALFSSKSSLFNLICTKYITLYKIHPFYDYITILKIFKHSWFTREQLLAHRPLLACLLIDYALKYCQKECSLTQAGEDNSQWYIFQKDHIEEILKEMFSVTTDFCYTGLHDVEFMPAPLGYVFRCDENELITMEGFSFIVPVNNWSGMQILHLIDLDQQMLRWGIRKDETTNTFYFDRDLQDANRQEITSKISFEEFYQSIISSTKHEIN